MAASITVLPPLTCTASRRHLRQLLFRCEAGHLVAAVSLRPVPGGESAGCVRLQWLCSAGCVPARLCHAHCPHHFSPFISSFALFALVQSMCARIKQHVCKLRDCPVGSCNTGLQRRPVRRSIFDSCYLFPAESMILGHGLV